ncbi:hypothetical protein MRX96_059478 [Rhipicephalus microplus]
MASSGAPLGLRLLQLAFRKCCVSITAERRLAYYRGFVLVATFLGVHLLSHDAAAPEHRQVRVAPGLQVRHARRLDRRHREQQPDVVQLGPFRRR